MRSLSLKTKTEHGDGLAAATWTRIQDSLGIKAPLTSSLPAFFIHHFLCYLPKQQKLVGMGVCRLLKVPTYIIMFVFLLCCQTHQAIHYEDRGCDSKDIASVIGAVCLQNTKATHNMSSAVRWIAYKSLCPFSASSLLHQISSHFFPKSRLLLRHGSARL